MHAYNKQIEFSENDIAHVAWVDYKDPDTDLNVKLFIGLIENNGKRTVQTSILSTADGPLEIIAGIIYDFRGKLDQDRNNIVPT